MTSPFPIRLPSGSVSLPVSPERGPLTTDPTGIAGNGDDCYDRSGAKAMSPKLEDEPYETDYKPEGRDENEAL